MMANTCRKEGSERRLGPTLVPKNLSSYMIRFGYPKSNDLLFLKGTSQAIPAVTGCVAVLRNVLRDKHQTTPTAALLKALIVHGAVDMVCTKLSVISRYKDNAKPVTTQEVVMTTAPNGFQGFVCVDIDNSLYPIHEKPITLQRGFLRRRRGLRRSEVGCCHQHSGWLHASQ